MEMYCPVCGAGIPPQSSFCLNCGARLSEPRIGVNSAPASSVPSRQLSEVRIEYIVGGGLIAAVLFGVFYWARTYTWTDRVWHEIYGGIGYWETVTHTIDPALQALSLVGAIAGLIVMVYGVVSRECPIQKVTPDGCVFGKDHREEARYYLRGGRHEVRFLWFRELPRCEVLSNVWPAPYGGRS